MNPIIHTFNRPAGNPSDPDFRPCHNQQDVEYRVGSWEVVYVLVFCPTDIAYASLADELKVFRDLIRNWQFEVYTYLDCDQTGRGAILKLWVPTGLTPDAQRLYIHDMCYDLVSEMMEEKGVEIHARMRAAEAAANGDVAMGEGQGDGDGDVDMDWGLDVHVDGDSDVVMSL